MGECSVRIGIDGRLAGRRGVGAYAEGLLSFLPKVAPRNWEWFFFECPSDFPAPAPNVRVLSSRHPPRGWRAVFYEQWGIVKTAERLGIDLLHFLDNTASCFASIPFVVTIHDLWWKQPARFARPNISWRGFMSWEYRRFFASRALPRAKAVLTPSIFTSEQVVKNYPKMKNRVSATSEALPLAAQKFFRSRKKDLRRERKRILVHATADRRKNLEGALAAFSLIRKRHPEAILEIVGFRESERRELKVEKLAERFALGSNVHWNGFLSFDDLYALYLKCDVMLFLSWEEGFGLPLLEAFAAKLPVVAAKAGAIPEVTGDAALLVDPARPDEAAREVERLWASRALYRHMQTLGRARLRLFSWRKTAQKTLEIYRQVLGL